MTGSSSSQPGCSLRPARLDDLQTVLRWVTTPEEIKLWGGPDLPFPPEPEPIWREIQATDGNTFSLTDPRGEVVGFGQALFREPDTVHLARIIVSVSERGRGLGLLLCRSLIRAGIERHHPAAVTLNVYRNNPPALRLYRSLGFEAVAEDAEQNMVRMRLRLDPHA